MRTRMMMAALLLATTVIGPTSAQQSEDRGKDQPRGEEEKSRIEGFD